MTITRANPSGWTLNQNLDKSLWNLLDGYATFMLDKRVNQADILSSNVTVDSSGEIVFATGSNLTLNNLSNVKITTGSLAIGAELNGDVTQSDPLRFGNKTVLVTSNSQALTAAQSTTFVITFTSTSDIGGTTIIAPKNTAYTKIIDNQMTGPGFLHITPAGGTGVDIPNGLSAVIYCDGTNIYSVSEQSSYQVVSEKNLVVPIGIEAHSATQGPGPLDVLGGSTTDNVFPFNLIFTDVQIGDFFEIHLNARGQFDRAAASSKSGFYLVIYASVGYGPSFSTGSIILGPGPVRLTNSYAINKDFPETEIGTTFFQPKQIIFDSSSTIFTVTDNPGNYEFFIRIASPLSVDGDTSYDIFNGALNVSHYRFQGGSSLV